MSKELVFELDFPGPDGKKMPLHLTVNSLKRLMAQLLDAASSVELPPNLEQMITLSENPVPTNGLAITLLEDDPTGARVSIGIGPIDLQFAVSLPLLFEALEDLKAKTKPASAFVGPVLS
jgi:hypothetical protein